MRHGQAADSLLHAVAARAVHFLWKPCAYPVERLCTTQGPGYPHPVHIVYNFLLAVRHKPPRCAQSVDNFVDIVENPSGFIHSSEESEGPALSHGASRCQIGSTDFSGYILTMRIHGWTRVPGPSADQEISCERSPFSNASGAGQVKRILSPVTGCVKVSDQACSISRGTFSPRADP